MWELDYKESWVSKNWCFWTVVLEKTLESPLDCKEIQPVHPKRNQSWMFIGRTDVEAETPIFWPPDVKSWLIWKDPDAGKDWGQEEKGMTEDEIVGWHGITNSRTLLKLMSIKLGMQSNHLILCRPLLLLPLIFPSIRVFSSELAFFLYVPQNIDRHYVCFSAPFFFFPG